MICNIFILWVLTLANELQYATFIIKATSYMSCYTFSVTLRMISSIIQWYRFRI